MKKLLLSMIAVLGFSFAFVIPVRADDPPDFDDENPDGIPVDGGASLLLAAGAGYGIKRLRAKKAAKAQVA